MNFIAVVTSPTIYHGLYTHNIFWEERFTLANMKSFGFHNVSKKIKSRMVSSTLPCPFIWNLMAWTRGNPPPQDHGIIWVDQVRN